MSHFIQKATPLYQKNDIRDKTMSYLRIFFDLLAQFYDIGKATLRGPFYIYRGVVKRHQKSDIAKEWSMSHFLDPMSLLVLRHTEK